MKITASNTQFVQPKVSPLNNNNVAEGVLKLDDKNITSRRAKALRESLRR